MNTSKPFGTFVTQNALWQSMMPLLAVLLLFNAPVKGQEFMMILTPEDGLYIYQDQQPRLGSGFNVYRTVDGVEQLLTDEPYFPATNGVEFRAMAGDLYQRLADDLEAESAQETFFALRGNRSLSLVLSLVYPEIALALGHLFIDPDPVVGRRVTYRLEWVNSRSIPTGEELVEQLVVDPAPMEIPLARRIEAERTGNRVRVSWQYPETSVAGSQVVRFEVFVRPAGAASYRRVTDRSVMRQTGMTRFEYAFVLDVDVQEADFVIQAVDHTGKNQRATEPVRLDLIDASVPSAVNEVYSARQDRNIVRLTWPVSPEPFVAGYHVDRLDPETSERVRLTDELIDLMNPAFVDDTAEGGQSWYYYVIAVSQTGVESEDGNPAIVFIERLVPPNPPSNLRATILGDEGVVRLDWTASEKDDLFNTYVILRRIHTGQRNLPFSQVNRSRVAGTRYIDEGIAGIGLTEGVFYEYAVTAANVHGLRSDTVFAVMQMPDITPPDPPATFRAEIDAGVRLNLSWGASPSPDVVTYHIYKVAVGEDTVMVPMPRSRRFIVDENVVPGNQYRYYATAVDSAGNESLPSRKVDVMMRDFAPPPTVRNVQAVAVEDGVQLRWEASASNDIAGYVVLRSELSNGVYVMLTQEPVMDVNWVDTGGRAGKWYQVHAVDVSGNRSRPSAPRQAVRNN